MEYAACIKKIQTLPLFLVISYQGCLISIPAVYRRYRRKLNNPGLGTAVHFFKLQFHKARNRNLLSGLPEPLYTLLFFDFIFQQLEGTRFCYFAENDGTSSVK